MLIRHAAHGDVGTTLSGRTEGLALTAEGRRQAQRLAGIIAGDPPDAVQSSPVQRARETAAAIARECGGEVETVEALDEIDFGEWTGRSFAGLEGDRAWQRWNSCRSQSSAPGGESMASAQARAIDHLRQAARRFAGGTVAMVTHSDIIRGIIAAILGLSLDHILRFEVDPASVSRVAAGAWGEKLIALNEGTA